MTQACQNVYDSDDPKTAIGEAEPAEFTVSESWLFERTVELFLARGCSVIAQPVRSHFVCEGLSAGFITNVGYRVSGCRMETTPFDPAFPLRYRTDLPEHERGISALSLQLLREGIAEAKAGKLSALPASVFEDDEDDK